MQGQQLGLSSTRADGLNPKLRIGPRHPRLGASGFHAARWLAARTMGPAGFHQLGSDFADDRMARIREKLGRGETVYLAGLGPPGTHNSGVALVEVSQANGPRLIVNNEEERFSGNKLGLSERVPLICMPHHDNHAWFSFAASPFADSDEPVAIAVLDGTGDRGSISLYVTGNGAMRRLYCNDSMFDSLGAFYSVISSTQGGWTWLSSEGRYMGAAAWGDMNRASNPYYARLKEVLHFGSGGEVRLNRAMANWYCDPFDHPYKPALIEILGPPLRPDQLWNPDAVLRVEDINHRPDTSDRLDKAAATQLVFEDAMIHVVDHLLRTTGATRLVLTGGVALNAVGNMRLLEHFDQAWFARSQQRKARLHLWVPPKPDRARSATARFSRTPVIPRPVSGSTSG